MASQNRDRHPPAPTYAAAASRSDLRASARVSTGAGARSGFASAVSAALLSAPSASDVTRSDAGGGIPEGFAEFAAASLNRRALRVDGYRPMQAPYRSRASSPTRPIAPERCNNDLFGTWRWRLPFVIPQRFLRWGELAQPTRFRGSGCGFGCVGGVGTFGSGSAAQFVEQRIERFVRRFRRASVAGRTRAPGVRARRIPKDTHRIARDRLRR